MRGYDRTSIRVTPIASRHCIRRRRALRPRSRRQPHHDPCGRRTGWDTLHAGGKPTAPIARPSSRTIAPAPIKLRASSGAGIEVGTHHHIADECPLPLLAGSLVTRRITPYNQRLEGHAGGGNAMLSPVSRTWKGYWQREQSTELSTNT